MQWLVSVYFFFVLFLFFIMVMATSAFVSPCSKLDDLYRCVGERLMDCPPQYRLMYETAVSSGRFVCNDGKQGRGDSAGQSMKVKYVNKTSDLVVGKKGWGF